MHGGCHEVRTITVVMFGTCVTGMTIADEERRPHPRSVDTPGCSHSEQDASATYTGEAVHELSVALALVELASEEAHRLGAVQISAVHVRIGQLAAIVPDALRFSFDLAAEGTALTGARLEIEPVPTSVACQACGTHVLDPFQPICCPRCGGPADLRSGRELELRALEVIDHDGPDC